MSIYDKSSLVLIPSGTKTSKVYSQKPTNGDGDFDFTRSTAATRVNADGNIEKETSNLLLQSNTFDNPTNWGLISTSVTGAQSGYDGTNDAWLLSKSSSSARVQQGIALSFSGITTLSVYAKAGTLNWVMLNNGFYSAWFDLANGVTGTLSGGIDSNIVSVGGGWYRCSLTANLSSGIIVRIYPSQADNDVSGTSGNIVIQDAMLEQSLVARDYIETTTTALYGGITDNVPRLDYTDSSCPALLLEPQRTNAMVNSEYFGGYTIGQMTLEHNYAISPEGIQNATRLIENTAAGTAHSVSIATPTTATEYAWSVYAKPNGRDFMYLYVGSGVGQGKIFDIANGTIGSNVGGAPNDTKIEDVGNGWYRCTIIVNAIAGSPTPSIGLANSSSSFTYTGDGTSGVLLYGAQLEAGSYATSYIPTYGTSVTRNGEGSSKSGVSELIGQTEGTIYAEFFMPNDYTGNETHRISLSDGSLNNWVFMSIPEVGDETRMYLRIGASTKIDAQTPNSPFTHNQVNKIAYGYKSGDLRIYINGVSVLSSSTIYGSFTLPLSRINITGGSGSSGSNQNMSNNVKQTMLFKTRLSNEELATLTTI